jgi:uncharacterized protein YndB with AHSA1/START domain
MASNDYTFISVWHVNAPTDLVYDILSDAETYPRWWPEVYLAVRVEPASDGGAIGTRAHLHTRGRLPYTLTWTAETLHADRPHTFEIRATGDFEGSGIWTLQPVAAGTRAAFEWRIRAEKPLLRTFSFLLKPVFRWNHHWAMTIGREALAREIARRSAEAATSG